MAFVQKISRAPLCAGDVGVMRLYVCLGAAQSLGLGVAVFGDVAGRGNAALMELPADTADDLVSLLKQIV